MRKPGNMAERPAPSFLTQEQREALDAALSKKRAEQRELCSRHWHHRAANHTAMHDDSCSAQRAPLRQSADHPSCRTCCSHTWLAPVRSAPPFHYARATLRLPAPPRLAATPAPTSASLAGDDAVGKPQLGKNPHNEGVKTKRELLHDHHLNRKGKGACAGGAGCRSRLAGRCPQ